MPIPDYQTLMLPVLKIAAEGEISVRACVDRLADEFRLAEEERNRLLPSGRQAIFSNRVHWAKTYLTKAGLLEMTRRGYFRVTKKGLQVLTKKPDRIDNEFLSQYSDFQAWRERSQSVSRSKLRESRPPVEVAAKIETPEERIEEAYNEIITEVRGDLIDRIVQANPSFFERVILDLMVSMGYGGTRAGAAQKVGQTGDGGIDGIINEDPLGLDIVYLQAKRYTPGNVVGVDKVREFAGSLVERGASKGVFVTTSHFAGKAREYADRIPQRLILIDGEELSRLLVRYGVGVRAAQTIQLHKIDLDYFEGENS